MPSTDDSTPRLGQALRQGFDALIQTLHEHHIRYAIIGGLAVLQHTRVRITDDIDALVIVPQIQMPGLFEALAQRGFTVDVARSIRELQGGFTSLGFGGIAVDLLQPIIPAYNRVLERAIEAEVYGRKISVSSAEGLILTKLISMRPQDEADIRDLLVAYAGKLDLDFLRRELDGFTEANHPTRGKFETLIRESTRQQ